jgi:ribosomal protein S18 acetylase RimI-like enzyme
MPEVIRLRTDDVEPLRELLRICWLDTYTGILPDDLIKATTEEWHSKENLSRGLSNPRTYYGGYFDEGVLLGMVAAGMVDRSTLKIFQLYVHPHQQRKGIGRKLMDTTIERFPEAHEVTLEVEEKNPRGVAFYRKYGFSYPRTTTVEVGGFKIPCLAGEMKISEK